MPIREGGVVVSAESRVSLPDDYLLELIVEVRELRGRIKALEASNRALEKQINNLTDLRSRGLGALWVLGLVFPVIGGVWWWLMSGFKVKLWQ